jgi:hypothetical protein
MTQPDPSFNALVTDTGIDPTRLMQLVNLSADLLSTVTFCVSVNPPPKPEITGGAQTHAAVADEDKYRTQLIPENLVQLIQRAGGPEFSDDNARKILTFVLASLALVGKTGLRKRR